VTAKPVSFEEARARAVALLDAPRPLMVVSDFDGTLSAIDPDPLGARIDPLGRVALRRLSRIAAARPDQLRVFVLSGRAALDVAARVRVGGLHYLGNHGLEGGPLPARARAERLAVALDDRLQTYVEPARALGRAVSAALGRPDWLFVEDKGPAVAFHYRAAPDPALARRLIDEAVGSVQADIATANLRRMEGRMVVEFQPAEAGGKGRAMARLLDRESPGAVLALGDDVSDAEAFATIAEARSAGSVTGLTVAVHGAHETPPLVLEAADIVLPVPHEAARLLSALGHELQRRLAPELPWMAGRGATRAAGGPRPAQPLAPVARPGPTGIAAVRGSGGHPPPPDD
jgi:trehalose 6-phosphate phosphatase